MTTKLNNIYPISYDLEKDLISLKLVNNTNFMTIKLNNM